MNCLESAYPQTLKWLGEEAFLAAAARHIYAVTSDSWTLDDYPRRFRATLAGCYPDDPEVGELAMLELALADAFVGPDATPIMAGDLAVTDWDTAALRLTPMAPIASGQKMHRERLSRLVNAHRLLRRTVENGTDGALLFHDRMSGKAAKHSRSRRGDSGPRPRKNGLNDRLIIRTWLWPSASWSRCQNLPTITVPSFPISGAPFNCSQMNASGLKIKENHPNGALDRR